MMSYIWGGMIVFSVLAAFFSGRTELVAQSILDGANSAVQMAISLAGMMCLWSGILEIAKRSGLTEKLAKLLSPLMRLLFPRLSPDSPAVRAMVMNITANMLGLSNAATPLGLAAMKELDRINPQKGVATDEMCMFVVINTASISLLPTTVITLRHAAGSTDPFGILIPVFLCSLCALVSGVITAHMMSMRRRGR
ncbi:MAG: spore maturation protein A [Ruminococcaceae bacterium]|nr:spore maturation protein A [Oscillospiraceae bacterium]